MRRKNYPFLIPASVQLSTKVAALRRIEKSGRFSNFGPINRAFEESLIAKLFNGRGTCCTVSNATLGLMLSVRATMRAGTRYAVLPSFTFAATAQAALWCGLKPLFCDIDQYTWLPDLDHINYLLRTHRGDVGVLMPYATFGNNFLISDYERLARMHRVPIVIDAAASLGSMTSSDCHFGSDSRFPVVYSMHATKTFSTSEGGIVYAGNEKTTRVIRRMANFGFDQQRIVRSIGLNAKLPEVIALQALEKLRELPRIVKHRSLLAAAYRRHLEGLTFQMAIGVCQSLQFLPARLTDVSLRQRDRLIQLAKKAGVEVRTYFQPPLHRQRFFGSNARLPVTERVSQNIVSLPLYDSMTIEDVYAISRVLNGIIREL